MKKITVSAGRGYDVTIAKGILKDSGNIIQSIENAGKAAIITDNTVDLIYGSILKDSLEAVGYEVCKFAFASGEESKNISTLSAILEFLAENKLTKGDIIVALGGGVVGDIAGFAASCYLRGLDFIQIPTTFLAAIDSSVGGKTAINLSSGKNLAGAFYQPRGVICDTDLFKSLPNHIMADGCAEAIKYGVILDNELFELIKNEDIKGNIEKIVESCVLLKAKIVETDEFDRGNRQLLNFGHTIGHAIEKCSSYKISHGNAVAIGMVMEAAAVSDSIAAEIASVNTKYGLPVSCEYTAHELHNAALHDKKRIGGEITLVVPNKVGQCVLKTIGIDDLAKYIAKGCGRGV